MLYMVRDNKLESVEAVAGKKHCEALDRLVEEWNGYLEYKEKASASNDSRYKSAAGDEFRHALVALFDMIAEIKKHASSEPEKAELSSFWTELVNAMAK